MTAPCADTDISAEIIFSAGGINGKIIGCSGHGLIGQINAIMVGDGSAI